MKQHIISPEASQDLSEIIDYFARTNIYGGERFVDEFDKKCKYSRLRCYEIHVET